MLSRWEYEFDLSLECLIVSCLCVFSCINSALWRWFGLSMLSLGEGIELTTTSSLDDEDELSISASISLCTFACSRIFSTDLLFFNSWSSQFNYSILLRMLPMFSCNFSLLFSFRYYSKFTNFCFNLACTCSPCAFISRACNASRLLFWGRGRGGRTASTLSAASTSSILYGLNYSASSLLGLGLKYENSDGSCWKTGERCIFLAE
jgi:hypothetical protein